MKAIETKDDLVFLIKEFYGKVLQNDLLSPFFRGFDMDEHIPHMVDFWSFVLLDEPGYKRNVIEKHLHMPLKKEHFDQWVAFFEATLDEHFEGDKVLLAKQRVAAIRWMMEAKIGK